MASISMLVLVLVQVIISACNPSRAATLPNFTSILIFGDSTVDTGNNNFVTTAFRGFLGIKQTVPPSLAPNLTNDDLRTCVSFASAGSGYDNLTTLLSGVIPVSNQLGMFKSYIAKLGNIVGNAEARNIIQKSFGLYNEGVRTTFIAGLPPMGCLPFLVTARLKDPHNRTCLEDENEAARSYNQKLVNLIPQLQASLPGTKLVYADVYTPLNDMLNNPQRYGFTTIDKGCGGTGILEASF
ncbi:hypothetical protein PTKIN_Ptkin11bG0100800 [Pterospermum kingtungense]